MGLFSKFKKQPDMEKIFEATDNLACKTVSMGMYLATEKTSSFLNKNEITLIDSVIFTTFYLTLFIANGSKGQHVTQVIDRYITFVFQLLEDNGGCWDGGLPQSVIEKMINNRYPLYANVLHSKSSLESGFSAVIEEFEYVIKHDIIEGEYKPFATDSPLPILGFEQDIMCHTEIAQFPGYIKGKMDSPMKMLLAVL